MLHIWMLKMRYYSIICFVVLSLYIETKGQPLDVQLPSYMRVCFRDDPRVADCLKNVIQYLLPIFKQGSAGFELPPLDPLAYHDLVYSYNSSILGGSFTVSKYQTAGLSSMTILRVLPVVTDSTKLIMDFDVYAPLMNVKANYIMAGNLLTVPLNVKGRVDVDFYNVTLRYHLACDVRRIGDLDYLVVKQFSWRPVGEGMSNAVFLNPDLIEGSPLLSRTAATVLSSYWRLIIKHIFPSLLPETDKVLVDVFAKFFMKYPYDVIFPKHYF